MKGMDSMARNESSVKNIMITQQMVKDYFAGCDDDFAKVLTTKLPNNDIKGLHDKALYITKWAVEKLETASKKDIAKAYGIIHDKDVLAPGEDGNDTDSEIPKAEHIHIIISFVGTGMTLTAVAKALGIKREHVDMAQGKKQAFENMLSYLIHSKDPHKYQYDPKQVATVRSDDYMDIYNKNIETWLRGSKMKSIAKYKEKDRIEELIDNFLNGRLLERDIYENDDIYQVYGRNRTAIDQAMDTYGRKKAYLESKKKQNGIFQTTVIYFTGRSRHGKSHASDELIKRLIAETAKAGKPWEYREIATSNAFDAYKGEEIIYMQDVRANILGPTDWLRVMDPKYSSPLPARYNNKEYVAPRVIIITAAKSVEAFYGPAAVSKDVTEDFNQFIGRVTHVSYHIRKIDNTGKKHYSMQVMDVGDTPEYQLEVTGKNIKKEFTMEYGIVRSGWTDDLDKGLRYYLESIKSKSKDINWVEGEVIDPADELVMLEEKDINNKQLQNVEVEDDDLNELLPGQTPFTEGEKHIAQLDSNTGFYVFELVED